MRRKYSEQEPSLKILFLSDWVLFLPERICLHFLNIKNKKKSTFDIYI